MEENSVHSLFDRVSVRDLSEADIPHLARYWFHSPAGYLEGIGVDPRKLPPQDVFENGLREKCRGPASKVNALIVTFNGRPVGFHTLNPLIEGDHAIFHAHIFDPSVRRQGIASVSYPKACHLFMQ